MDPLTLRQAHARLRVDLLRRYLREGPVDYQAAAQDLDHWIALFQSERDPALLVLILELLSGVDDPRVLGLAEQATTNRHDGVRLEGLHLLLDRQPGRASELATQHREDDSLEVRLLLMNRILPHDRAFALDLAFTVLEEEEGGPRHLHALERVTETLVEDGGSDVRQRLADLPDDYEDLEGFVAWAIEEIDKKR